jgi:hypothetical protein
MNNNTIRTALASVLIYLCFKKGYDILITLLLWVSAELKIKNEAILGSLIITIGLLSIIALISFANKFLHLEKIKARTLYFLIGFSILLTICTFVINVMFGNYIGNVGGGGFVGRYLIQFGWSKVISLLFPIIALIFFLWKIRRNSAANNG